MNSYQDYVREYAALLNQASCITPANATPLARTPVHADAPILLIFSPHPDDEAITGGLPLRLLKEGGYRVINVAVTLGSSKARRDERKRELANACRHLGFELVLPMESGLENINLTTKQEANAEWLNAVSHITSIINEYNPHILILPHANDWNTTHIGTHHLVKDALRESDNAMCHVVENEFWHPMKQPGIMVESSCEDVAELITALSYHLKEIERNPYHLNLPSWMQDNVRRGSELLGKQGGHAPKFTFATLYKIHHWQNGTLKQIHVEHPFISTQQNIQVLFKD